MKMCKKGSAILIILAVLFSMPFTSPVFAIDFSSAERINLNTEVSGWLANSDSENFYKFTLDNPGRVYLTFTHENIESGSCYWQIYLFNEEQTEILSFDSNGNKTSAKSINAYLSSGSYFVRIKPYYHNDAKYKLTVSYELNSGQYEIEPNNTKQTATLINSESKYITGNLGNTSDEDYFKVILPKSGKVALNFAHENIESSSSYWQINMFDENENEITSFYSEGNKTSSNSINAYLAGGTYYVRVKPYYHSDADYKLSYSFDQNNGQYEIEPNDTLQQASPIGALQFPVSGNLGFSSDVDYFKFIVLKPGDFIIKFKHGNIERGSSYWQINLFDKSEKDLEEFFSDGNQTEATSQAIHLQNGTYYIRVKAYYHSDADYNIILTSVNGAVDGSSLPQTETQIVSEWAKPEIEKAEAMGLIPEVLKNKPDLTMPINRAEFAALSVKVYEVLSGNTAVPAIYNPFTDTQDIDVLKSYNVGITIGTSANTFSPGVLLNREQAATMLTRVFKKINIPGWTLANDAYFTLQYTSPDRKSTRLNSSH